MNIEDKVTTLKGIGPKKAELLSKQNIDTLEDLLYLFPRKYEDRRNTTPIGELEVGKDYLISGKVLSRRYRAS